MTAQPDEGPKGGYTQVILEEKHSSSAVGSGFLRLFRRNGEASQPAEAQQAGRADSKNENLVQGARRTLLERISRFLITHDLEVSSSNLTFAAMAFSGSDLTLARKVAERENAGLPIDQHWLDDLMPEDPDTLDETLSSEQLYAKLEQAIERFSSTARSARTATSDYRSELTRQSETLNGIDDASGMVRDMVELTKVMLTRSRQVEEDIKRSEREAADLRQSLERAQHDARIDHLTGLPNRRAFEALLEAQYRAAQQDIEPLSVAFCDIDHFKSVNDTHGHETGDRIIQAIGQALARISDERCHVARHGGEEFVMLFRGLTKHDAAAKLDAAREQLGRRRFVNRATDEPIGQITFSGGVSDIFAYPDPRQALRAADAALYRAKTQGRNQIEVDNT